MDAGKFHGVRRTVVRAGNHWHPPVDVSNKGTGVLKTPGAVRPVVRDSGVDAPRPQDLLLGANHAASPNSPYMILMLLQLMCKAVIKKEA